MAVMRIFSILFLGGMAALLSACEGSTVKQSLGIDRAPPDEFRVVSHPPLSVPPEFALRPPAVAAELPAQTQTGDQARSLIVGDKEKNNATGTKNKARTTAETQFLQKAGANQADPNVRSDLEAQKLRQIEQQEEEDDRWWNIGGYVPKKKDPLVDAGKETERIKENKAGGKPVNAGDTPEVKARDTGVLGEIFGY